MKTFKPNTKSWHYKAVLEHAHYVQEYSYDFFDRDKPIEEFMPKDFCTYWRVVTANLLRRFVNVAFVVLQWVIVVIGVILIGMLIHLFVTNVSPVVLILSLLALVSVYFGGKWYNNRSKSKSEKHQEDNIFKMKYRSWKDKYCAKVEYE